VAELSPDVQAQVARLYDLAVGVAGSVALVDPPPRVRERVLAAARTPARYTVHAGLADWFETGLPGVRAKVLALDKVREMATLVIRAEPGAVYPSHTHHAPEECYVLSGSIFIDGRELHAGDFHHADADTDHGEITTVRGAEVLIVGAIEDYLPGF
jgi:anti-sigma factor ChrR (cupin superfamily)